MQHASVPLIEEGRISRGLESSPEARLIARSASMQEILALVRKIADTSVPVLIHGEIGTGKHTVAREIHRQSPRAAKPFVHVNCASLRDSDLEEKLFGRPGDGVQGGGGRPASLLESSQSSTLFLDGVVQLPFWAQVKLLEVLQRRGGLDSQAGIPVASRARVIASTTSDLEAAVLENRFYSGLYYYLNAVRIEVPPLRHRQEDIGALAEHFLACASAGQDSVWHKVPRGFSDGAWQSLLHYDWPGNILQLASVVAHLAAVAEGPEIGLASVTGLLGRARRPPSSEAISVPLAGGLRGMELALIHEVIRQCRGNKAAAARALGLHRRTLYRLLEE